MSGKQDRKRFQSPKGTRDFYPPEMAWRRYLENAWRLVATRHGFEEMEGPMFESLDLYKVKSGEGIVSELFSFTDRGGRDFALRPEFTPTLARMVVAKAASLPKPIKWFSIPDHFRAERPQRGRLREFLQWNVDFLGDDSSIADAEVLGVAIDLLSELSLTRDIVRVRISHRGAVCSCLRTLGLSESQLQPALTLLDRRDKIEAEEFLKRAGEIGLTEDAVAQFDALARQSVSASNPWERIIEKFDVENESDLDELRELHDAITDLGLAPWCDYDLGIVRGLAYYTGMVFEVHEATGKERAIAGGGRYDQLIESFGGPSMPAVGFGMGDVVLSLVLDDHGLKLDWESLRPTPDVFLISRGDEESEALLPSLLYEFRRQGIHARRTYRSTRNFGKLMKEASNSGAKYALILSGDEIDDDLFLLKEMKTGHQSEIDKREIIGEILKRLGRYGERGLPLDL